jgi:hypothetical protein
MTYYKNSSLASMGKSLALELFWLKAELIRMYSNGTNKCERCGARSAPRKTLQIHHRKHDGDTERFRWEMNTNTPHLMGYYYTMYFEYKSDPEKAKLRYGILCPKCNRIDHVAREAVAKGNSSLQDLVVDAPMQVPSVEDDGATYDIGPELDER